MGKLTGIARRRDVRQSRCGLPARSSTSSWAAPPPKASTSRSWPRRGERSELSPGQEGKVGKQAHLSVGEKVAKGKTMRTWRTFLALFFISVDAWRPLAGLATAGRYWSGMYRLWFSLR